MKVLTVGGGPAGLYASLLLKKARPDADVTILERNPAGATYGWGVVFSDRTLAEFREADPPTSDAITERFVLWDAIDVRYRDEVIRSGGHVFAGIARVALLGVLQRRCQELGVRIRYVEELFDVADLAGHDLVLAADGVHSSIRDAHAKVFRPRLETGSSRFIWFGARLPLDSFTFIFRENEHGLFQVHAYPYDGEHCTFIVETDQATWERAGLDRADETGSIAYCERLFAEDLRGARLRSNRSTWIAFVTVRNRTWRHGNVALLGDAAHTAHFTIGSGTKLAMEDAIALAGAVERHGDDIENALADYEQARKPVVERFQDAAAESRTYFENTRRYVHLEPMPFAFHLLTRSGRIDHSTLRLRDPAYVDRVDRWFAGAPLAPPPLFTPLALRSLELPNRSVAVVRPKRRQAVRDAAVSGAGLVVTEIAAVSAEGRITPESPGLSRDEHVDGWRDLVEEIHRTGARAAIPVGHAGRRGSTRPRDDGLDRPLREGGWTLLSASPLPYTARGRVPQEMLEADLSRVRQEFVSAARRASATDADALLVHMGHGYLLASFLSPLTNERPDQYGGSLENRITYPLEVFRAVRQAWPEDRPVGAVVSADDWAPGGWSPDDAVALAAALRAAGCDLVMPVTGQTVPGGRPRYGRGFLVPYADRLRNEARIATVAGGGITTTDQAHTILAGERADLCVLDPSP
ncbi:MAG: FAD-dependent monooxygenase [Actinomycetota bacterium]